MRYLGVIAAAAAASVWMPAPQAAGACQAGWAVVASPDPGQKGDNVLKAIAGVARNDIWAVGQYAADSNPNILLTLAEHYDGTAWSVVATPNDGVQANSLQSVAVASDGHAWAVGYHIDDKTFFARSLIETWNGSAWAVTAHPEPGNAAHLFAAAAVSPDDVWAVGETEATIGNTATLVEHFDGKSWQVVASPNPGNLGNILYGVSARTPTDVWAVGAQTNRGGPDRALILHWDGTAWHSLAAPADGTSNTALYAIDVHAGAPVAVGAAEDDIAGRALPLAEGAPGFGMLSVAATSRGDDYLYGVFAGPRGQWAVGSQVYWQGGGNPNTLIEHRAAVGTDWTVVPSPDPSPGGENQLGGVTAFGDEVWAVGAHAGAGSLRTLVLRSCH